MQVLTLAAIRRWLRRHPAAQQGARLAMRAARRWAPGLRQAALRLSDPWSDVAAPEYQSWIARHDRLTPELAARIGAGIRRMAHPPRISVVMPAYNTPLPHLRAAIESLRQQIYPHWELCIADDASPQPHVAAVLREAAAQDPRIRFVRRHRNGHISAASNSALALATGEFVALMDHDDLLPPHALAAVAHHILAAPGLEVLFSDEDMVDEHGRRSQPYFKPGWNPELLLGQNLINHLAVYRRRRLEAIGGFREGFEGSQDWDLALRATAGLRRDQVRHLPLVLYHWRQGAASASFSESALERCAAAGRRAVAEHLAPQGAQVLPQPDLPGWPRVAFPLPAPLPSLSVLLTPGDGPAPSLDLPGLDAEILPVAPGGREAALRAARGAVLLFLDGHLCPEHPEWLAELLAQALRPGAGAVGPLVLDAQGRALRAGLLLDQDGETLGEVPYLTGLRFPSAGYRGQLRLPREVSALDGDCLMLRRAAFEAAAVSGTAWLDAPDWNRLLCQRLRAAGHAVIWTPQARLRAPSATTVLAGQREILGDPFFNPNLASSGRGLRLRDARGPLAALAEAMDSAPDA